MSPAGTSVSGPMCRLSSVMKLWQKRMTSLSLLPLGSKSDPPLPPPIGSVVSEFLNTCSNARNLRMPRLTDGWNRSPPLYGPIALFISIRNPRLSWTVPRSSTHGTRNIRTRSGSMIRSRIFERRYSGWRSSTSDSDSATSCTAWWNSGSAGFLAFTSAISVETWSVMGGTLSPGLRVVARDFAIIIWRAASGDGHRDQLVGEEHEHHFLGRDQPR